ncbi:MAG: Fe-Mn family superoxide dismutase, partial [Candidatus Uhrbacteria bacterium]
MTYQTKNFSHLLGLPGFSDTMLQNHLTLYEGYVANTNKMIEKIIKLHNDNQMNDPEFAELKRRFGWEFNGMRLHELYFENLTKNTTEPDMDLTVIKAVIEQINSFQAFADYFRAVALLRGIGWVILDYDPQSKIFLTSWVNEHDVGHPVGCTPLLVLDVFEHAYLTDYGLNRTSYVDAFFKAIDWQ